MVAGFGQRGGDELGLAPVAVGWDHQTAGDLVGVGRAVVEADQVKAQVHGGGLASGGEDVAVVDIEDVRIDGGLGVAAGQFPGVGPVGGGALPVEESGRAQDEGAGAQGSDAGAGRVGGSHRFDEVGGRFAVRVGPPGHDHRVGSGEVFESVVGF
ncbi:hypothetical protein HS99_0005400 [Kitasatospora aureofaciens]|uniref:Uncharacterized protein n=1 Tax=Kitasatospora aureofaciens TaxID=1894 RepID=A0A1E7N980_KITAU|nr:hypothetical protein HS99_0005400 [Kitasatospora aureofaciens]GGU95996.1 hypothetical protein GCM10010502_57450 [Kitasatospora aureofaciens]